MYIENKDNIFFLAWDNPFFRAVTGVFKHLTNLSFLIIRNKIKTADFNYRSLKFLKHI